MNFKSIDIKPGSWLKITPDLLSPRIIVGSYWIVPPTYGIQYFNPGMHLILITHGELHFLAHGKTIKKAGAREMVAIFPGKGHYRVSGETPLSMYQLGFFSSLPPNHQGIPFLPGYGDFPDRINAGEEWDEFVSLFEQIIHLLMTLPAAWPSATSARLIDLINLSFNQETKENNNSTKHMDQWDYVIAQLEDYQNPPRIKQLAESMNISPEQFIRKFKKYTGHTPKHYLQERRLWKARQMLISGKMVKEAAFECGFQDQLYFSRLFKKHFGIAPSKFSTDNNESTISIDPALPISRNFFAPGMNISQVY